MSVIIMVGLDLAKSVFQAHGADASGRAVLRKKLQQDQVLDIFGRLDEGKCLSHRSGSKTEEACVGSGVLNELPLVSWTPATFRFRCPSLKSTGDSMPLFICLRFDSELCLA